MKQLNSLSHLELVVNSNVLLPVKVGHDDLQLVILLAGQFVDLLKAKPALSWKGTLSVTEEMGQKEEEKDSACSILVVGWSDCYFNKPLAENPSLYSSKALSKKSTGLPTFFRTSILIV